MARLNKTEKLAYKLTMAARDTKGAMISYGATEEQANDIGHYHALIAIAQENNIAAIYGPHHNDMNDVFVFFPQKEWEQLWNSELSRQNISRHLEIQAQQAWNYMYSL